MAAVNRLRDERSVGRAIYRVVLFWVTALSTAAVATSVGGVIEGIRPDDRDVRLFDGGYLLHRGDGGWAVIRDLPDGGAGVYPATAPNGYFLWSSDGGWSTVRVLPDGGQLVTVGEKPPGF